MYFQGLQALLWLPLQQKLETSDNPALVSTAANQLEKVAKPSAPA
jgi:hypothetical protein